MMNTPLLDYLERNKVINGAFDLWQRNNGNSAITVGGAAAYIGPDRFRFSMANITTPQLLRETVVVPARSKYACKLSGTAAANGLWNVSHLIESWEMLDLIGEQISLAFKVQSETFQLATIYFIAPNSADNYSGGNTVLYTTTRALTVAPGSYQTIAVEGFTVPAACKLGLGVYIVFSNPANTVLSKALYLGEFSVTRGAQAPAFTRAGRYQADEIILCQRYCLKNRPIDINIQDGGLNINADYEVFWASRTGVTIDGYWSFDIVFPIEMRATPTITSRSNSDVTTGTPIRCIFQRFVAGVENGYNSLIGINTKMFKINGNFTGMNASGDVSYIAIRYLADAEIN